MTEHTKPRVLVFIVAYNTEKTINTVVRPFVQILKSFTDRSAASGHAARLKSASRGWGFTFRDDGVQEQAVVWRQTHFITWAVHPSTRREDRSDYGVVASVCQHERRVAATLSHLSSPHDPADVGDGGVVPLPRTLKPSTVLARPVYVGSGVEQAVTIPERPFSASNPPYTTAFPHRPSA